jgi:hypothetical protein
MTSYFEVSDFYTEIPPQFTLNITGKLPNEIKRIATINALKRELILKGYAVHEEIILPPENFFTVFRSSNFSLYITESLIKEICSCLLSFGSVDLLAIFEVPLLDHQNSFITWIKEEIVCFEPLVTLDKFLVTYKLIDDFMESETFSIIEHKWLQPSSLNKLLVSRKNLLLDSYNNCPLSVRIDRFRYQGLLSLKEPTIISSEYLTASSRKLLIEILTLAVSKSLNQPNIVLDADKKIKSAMKLLNLPVTEKYLTEPSWLYTITDLTEYFEYLTSIASQTGDDNLCDLCRKFSSASTIAKIDKKFFQSFLKETEKSTPMHPRLFRLQLETAKKTGIPAELMTEKCQR